MLSLVEAFMESFSRIYLWKAYRSPISETCSWLLTNASPITLGVGSAESSEINTSRTKRVPKSVIETSFITALPFVLDKAIDVLLLQKFTLALFRQFLNVALIEDVKQLVTHGNLV